MLRTIRFDDSDKNVFDSAAEEGEWAISSAFQFCDKQWDDIDGKSRQAFNNGFLSLSSFGYSTFGSVTEISSSQMDRAQMLLARYLFENFGAPDLEAAMGAALEEISFINELCADVNPGKVFAVRREFSAGGHINESYHMIEAEDDECAHHGDIWEIVQD
ncbi:MAG: hypothetical protein GY761_19020 [Hyphomicrobiales bacterium]|nr:hypothetical protein [Hyphomicrobiales bacterium]